MDCKEIILNNICSLDSSLLQGFSIGPAKCAEIRKSCTIRLSENHANVVPSIVTHVFFIHRVSQVTPEYWDPLGHRGLRLVESV